MFASRSLAASVVLASVLLNPILAHAAVFPDVPDDHIYVEAIERLVGLKVINGNPDGRFHPERAVNRAELLTMLYRALGSMPEAASANCFSDVPAGSWYAAVVCDAATKRIVEGYSDGRFRPEKEVNRVEAVKMIMNMFAISVPEFTQENRGIVKYVDVSLSAWYTKYLVAAFSNGILPISGQVGPRFYPDAPLLRGEAAAYIYNALPFLQGSEALREEEETLEPVDVPEATSGASSSAKAGPVTALIKQVDFPFSDAGTFVGKQAISYRFTLKTPVTGDVSVKVGDKDARVSCRIFKLMDLGLSLEYYLGLQSAGSCWMRVTLSAGQYQLDIQPTIADASFTVLTKPMKGDGNDGFTEARGILKGVPRSGDLPVDDYADWYTFKLTKETPMTIELTTAHTMDAIIYPMEDVDLYGFSGPQANKPYTYPTGTYYVGVRRGSVLLGKQTYTLQLK